MTEIKQYIHLMFVSTVHETCNIFQPIEPLKLAAILVLSSNLAICLWSSIIRKML